MNSNDNIFSCVLLGEGSLLAECIHLLISSNFSINLIILNSAEVDSINDNLTTDYSISLDINDLLDIPKVDLTCPVFSYQN